LQLRPNLVSRWAERLSSRSVIVAKTSRPIPGLSRHNVQDHRTTLSHIRAQVLAFFLDSDTIGADPCLEPSAVAHAVQARSCLTQLHPPRGDGRANTRPYRRDDSPSSLLACTTRKNPLGRRRINLRSVEITSVVPCCGSTQPSRGHRVANSGRPHRPIRHRRRRFNLSDSFLRRRLLARRRGALPPPDSVARSRTPTSQFAYAVCDDDRRG